MVSFVFLSQFGQSFAAAGNRVTHGKKQTELVHVNLVSVQGEYTLCFYRTKTGG